MLLSRQKKSRAQDKLVFKKFKKIVVYATSTWSRGMIPASGAGGPGFNPRSGPFSHSVSWNRAWERYGFYYLPAWDLIVLLLS
jgi:hypothetical protein